MISTINRPAVFLDRDGVLNYGSKVDRADQFELIPGAAAALASLGRAGYPRVVATNQGGLGECLQGTVIWDQARLDRTHLNAIHAKMNHLLGDGCPDLIKFCPHAYWDERGDCNCHKPKPGMFIEAARELHIDLSRSWMIGDRCGDMEAAKNAGILNRILVKTGDHPNEEDKVKGGLYIVPSVVEAAALILAFQRHERTFSSAC